jgi:hypothetical protein
VTSDQLNHLAELMTFWARWHGFINKQESLEFRLVASGRPEATSQISEENGEVLISPENQINIPRKPNRSFSPVGPAVLTKDGVEQILGTFRGEEQKALRFLLIDRRNEPTGRLSQDCGEGPLQYSETAINKILKETVFLGKKFRLLGYGRPYRCQLWEVK